jgi:hypothetical protein
MSRFCIGARLILNGAFGLAAFEDMDLTVDDIRTCDVVVIFYLE